MDSRNLILSDYAAAALAASGGETVMSPRDSGRSLRAARGRVIERQSPSPPKYPNVIKGSLDRSTKEKRKKLAKLLGR